MLLVNMEEAKRGRNKKIIYKKFKKISNTKKEITITKIDRFRGDAAR